MKEIELLVKRHANLKRSLSLTYSSVICDAIDRIEKEYILLTGSEIKDHGKIHS